MRNADHGGAPTPSVSVVVTTYNWPAALAVSLGSLLRQNVGDFEILVADDGSGDETRDLVRTLRQREPPAPIIHVWHPDTGPRPAAIRNRAIERARGDYILLIDGDCFVLADFVAMHRSLAEPGWFVSGKRSFLRTGMTRRMLARPERRVGGRARWFAHSLMNRCTRPFEFVPLPRARRGLPQEWRMVQTCNMGFWRADWDAVNGFDERYLGVGLEDSDFAIRLIRSGIRRKRGDSASIVLHLEHPRRFHPPESRSAELFGEVLAGDYTVAPIGTRQPTTTIRAPG